MTKEELKNGMYVKLRNDTLKLVVGDKLMDSHGSFNTICYYDDNLKHTMSDQWDIMVVYVSSSPILFKEDALEQIWGRALKPFHAPKVGDLYVINDSDLNLNHDDIYLILNITDNRNKGGTIAYDVLNTYGNDVYFDTWYGKLDDNVKFIKSMPDTVEKFNSVIKSIKEAYVKI